MTQSFLGRAIDDVFDFLDDNVDPWKSIPAPVPYHLFGQGSRHPFEWYHDGPSKVSVSSVHDIEYWLLGCEYASDRQLFGQADHWMHPGEFEQIRMGDCDDHCTWAWRKMVELDIPASLFFGKWLEDGPEHHTWLVAEIDGEEVLFEATAKVLGELRRPLASVKKDYRPYFSVDHRFQTRAYLGAVQDLAYAPFEAFGIKD